MRERVGSGAKGVFERRLFGQPDAPFYSQVTSGKFERLSNGMPTLIRCDLRFMLQR